MRKKHPTLGQVKVRLSRGICFTAKGFAELKDHRTGKELQADLEWDCQHLEPMGTPGLYSDFISAVGSWFSRVMLNKVNIGELSLWQEESRENQEGQNGDDAEYVNEQGAVLQRALRLVTQLLGHATFTKKQSMSYQSAGRNPVHAGDCGEAPQYVSYKLWTL